MPRLIPVKVECYSGYVADEYPGCFYLDENKYEIQEVVDRWYQGEVDPEFPISDYFKVIVTDQKQFILKHEIRDDKWYLYK